MQIKTISWERVLNLGNYESRRLHVGADVSPDEDPETAITALGELVERKARESFDLLWDIKELKKQKRELYEEIEQLKTEKNKLTGVEDNPDDIPFDAGATPPPPPPDNFDPISNDYDQT